MPFYIFENPETKERREVRQRMADVHEYTDENGLKWNRVFLAGNMSVDSRPNVDCTKSLANSTSNKKETVGDIQDRAREASDKRKEKTATTQFNRSGLILTPKKRRKTSPKRPIGWWRRL